MRHRNDGIDLIDGRAIIHRDSFRDYDADATPRRAALESSMKNASNRTQKSHSRIIHADKSSRGAVPGGNGLGAEMIGRGKEGSAACQEEEGPERIAACSSLLEADPR